MAWRKNCPFWGGLLLSVPRHASWRWCCYQRRDNMQRPLARTNNERTARGRRESVLRPLVSAASHCVTWRKSALHGRDPLSNTSGSAGPLPFVCGAALRAPGSPKKGQQLGERTKPSAVCFRLGQDTKVYIPTPQGREANFTAVPIIPSLHEQQPSGDQHGKPQITQRALPPHACFTRDPVCLVALVPLTGCRPRPKGRQGTCRHSRWPGSCRDKRARSYPSESANGSVFGTSHVLS